MLGLLTGLGVGGDELLIARHRDDRVVHDVLDLDARDATGWPRTARIRPALVNLGGSLLLGFGAALLGRAIGVAL